MSVDQTQITHWAAILSGSDVNTQIESLQQISTKDKVTGLCQMVVPLSGSRHDEVRMWAAEVLESIVQPHPAEVDRLIELLQTAEDGEVCYWAATMLGRLGTDAARACAALQACAGGSGYLPARERAVWALVQIGPAAVSAVETLRRILPNAPPRLKRITGKAIDLIEGRGPASSAA